MRAYSLAVAGRPTGDSGDASLAIVIDAKMIMFEVVAIMVVLAWLVALLYSLYRNH
jgi:hypothetical protein